MKNEIHSVLLEHNVFIVWKPEYNLGIPIIDEQHRGIVTIINSLSCGMQHNCINNMLRSITDMMVSYTNIHFRTEEIFLEMIDFPHVGEHQKLHKELSEKLNSVGIDSMLNNDPYELMNFLKQWWINHICNEDLKYRNYLHTT